MYTIKDLNNSIIKLKKLKIALKQTEFYDHGFWNITEAEQETLKNRGHFPIPECGTPSCALGHAAILFPDEFKNINFTDQIKVIIDTQPIMGLSFVLMQYLFLFSVTSERGFKQYCRSIQPNSKLSRKSHGIKETLIRIDKVEEYLRRKLATLIAEKESKAKRRYASMSNV